MMTADFIKGGEFEFISCREPFKARDKCVEAFQQVALSVGQPCLCSEEGWEHSLLPAPQQAQEGKLAKVLSMRTIMLNYPNGKMWTSIENRIGVQNQPTNRSSEKWGSGEKNPEHTVSQTLAPHGRAAWEAQRSVRL